MSLATTALGGSPARLVGAVCSAQVLVQIGAFFWPALLPGMIRLWDLTNSEAGWITASFYGAYMVSVPVLVTLTDRVDPKRVYLFGVASTVAGHLLFGLLAEGFWSALILRALTGMGWAGTYMTGLKLLADRVDAKMMSRATAGHAASIGISGALSFATGDLIAAAAGWQAAFFTAAASAAIAWLLGGGDRSRTRQTRQLRRRTDTGSTISGRCSETRSAMAYAIAYCVHTLEMSALRGWGVAFLGYVAVTTGAARIHPVAGHRRHRASGLIGTFASVAGNEAAIRYRPQASHRDRDAGIDPASARPSASSAAPPMPWPPCLLTLYGVVIWLDSSSLTAGTAGTAEPSRRGATLAVHSMLGYAGGFVGPLLVGWMLDLSGGMSQLGWGLSFLSVGDADGARADHVLGDPASRTRGRQAQATMRGMMCEKKSEGGRPAPTPCWSPSMRSASRRSRRGGRATTALACSRSPSSRIPAGH